MRQHERLVLGSALRLLGHADDAKDAAQEVFLRLFKYAASLDPDQPMAPWLYRVTVNVCRDAVRQRMAARRVFASDDPADHPGGAIDGAIENGMLTSQRRRVMREALAEMPERERLALVLRDIEGLETHEVARMLGTSEVTVRTQVSRGRLRLKRLVDGMMRRTRT
jgi:RNA polymerase sigma-70 factor, ECF subfamily